MNPHQCNGKQCNARWHQHAMQQMAAPLCAVLVLPQLRTPGRAGTALHRRHRDAAPCRVVCDTDLHDDAIRAALCNSGCRHRPAQSRLLHRAVQLRMTSQILTAVREIARRRAAPTLGDLHSSMQAPASCAGPRPSRNRDADGVGRKTARCLSEGFEVCQME